MTNFTTINEIKAANKARGHHWFDPDSMKFFQSRVGKKVYAGRYFISSERNEGVTWTGNGYREYDYGRKYTVRKANPDGSIDDVSKFQQFDTAAQARAYIKRICRLAERISNHA